MAENKTSSEAQPLYGEIAKLVPLSVAIVITNVLVIVLFFKRRYLQRVPNYPLISLAVCDFTTGFVNIPLFIITFLTSEIRSQEARTYLSYLVLVLHVLTATATVYHILVVIAEKYFAIVWPLKHRRLTRKAMLTVIAAVWLLSSLIGLIPFSWINVSDEATKRKLFLGHGIFCLFAVFVLSYVFIVYALIVMFRVISGKLRQKEPSLLRRNNRTRELINNQRRRVCGIIFAVMATVFALCWLPWYMLVLLVNLQVHVKNLDSFMQWFVPFRYLTCIVNPLLYTFFKPDFRRAFKELLWNKLLCKNSSVPQFNMTWRRAALSQDKAPKIPYPNISALPLVKRESRINTMELNKTCFVSSV